MSSEHPEMRSIANYEALITAIANGETLRVKSLLANQSMLELEKAYLLDLARLNHNSDIIGLIEAVPQKR